MTTPPWYVTPDQQCELLRELNRKHAWGFSAINFPRVPDDFEPRTETEILMLNAFLPRRKDQPGLMRTIRQLWPLIHQPLGHNKWCSNLILNEFGFRLRDQPYSPGISWIGFDYNAYRDSELGPSVAIYQSKQDNNRLAGTEVLMATVLFPEWVDSWIGDSSPYVNLLGIEFTNANSTLALFTTEAFGWLKPSELRFDTYNATELRYRTGVSPTVREC